MNAIATKNWMDYEVGQRVYLVNRHGEKRYVTVEKVGRKWVYFSELSNEFDSPTSKERGIL